MDDVGDESASEDLCPSILGTQEYWNNMYESELDNYESFGNEGEIWFGRQCERRVVEWCKSNISKSLSILDLGCGNGSLLRSLAKEGYSSLDGIDYSPSGIALATKLEYKHKICGQSGQQSTIQFSVVDFLANELDNTLLRRFSLVIDKGTYDAISLTEDSLQNRLKYKRNLCKVFAEASGSADASKFLIVSCNWTKEELIAHFQPFVLTDEIAAPQIAFGGKTGNTITTLVFSVRFPVT